MPNDGVVTAPDVVATFAKKAKQMGMTSLGLHFKDFFTLNNSPKCFDN